MKLLTEHIWLVLFVVWGLPLTWYRSKFRKLVYQTDRWVINIKPVFGKELRGLFGNLYPNNRRYRKFRNFYRFYLAVYLLLFLFYLNHSTYSQTTKNKAMEKITVGSTIPSFALKDQHGNRFDIDSVLYKKNLVIYFYPKDDSPGCTREACSFRDQYEVFREADALVIGISSQSVKSHSDFAQKYNLNFTLLSDPNNGVRKMFGVRANFFGLLPGRVTFIVNKEGKVEYVFDSQLQAEKHVDEALRILNQLK